MPSAAEYVAAVMADGPRAFWTMQDASGNPQDSSGNGLHITSTNGTPDYQQQGPLGGSFSINLAFAEFFTRADFSTSTTRWAIELWWFPVTVGASGRTIVRTDQNGTTTGWGIGTNGNAANSKFTGLHGNGFRTESVNTPPLNTWSHLAVGRREVTPGTNQWFYYYNGAADTDPVTDTAPGVPAGITQINAGNFLEARYAYIALYEKNMAPQRFAAHYEAAVGASITRAPIVYGRGAA